MPDQEYTTIKIKKRFDEDGKPTCEECVFYNYDFSDCGVALGWDDWGLKVRPTCPVHHPKPDAPPL